MNKIDFEFQTHYGIYRDALYLPDEYSYTQEQISEIKSERLRSWIQSVENPTVLNYITVNGAVYEQVEYEGQTFLKPVEISNG
jgi:hypothetical protein